MNIEPRLYSGLLSENPAVQAQSARTVRSLGTQTIYIKAIIDAVKESHPQWRGRMGDALSFLGDSRFAAPYFSSEMMAVPGGKSVLGDPHYPDECPVHVVEVRRFSLSQYPVTQAAYEVFVRAVKWRAPRDWHGVFRKKPEPSRLNAPVVNISAVDALAYCEWLSGETGYQYRLPTEAEWVLAARGSGDNRVYPWGDEFEPARANAFYAGAMNRLCAVGLFPCGHGPNKHGDLAGNVWEWCSTQFEPYPTTQSIVSRTDMERGVPVAVHGGSWRSKPTSVRCSARQGENPKDSFPVTGFRIARDA